MLSKKILAAAVVLSLTAACAHADDSFSWHFSGFGTAGVVDTQSSDVLLTNPGQLKGAQKDASALVDSRLGGQLDLTFNSRLSATAQAIAMQDTKGRFRPTVEWAFLRYKFTPGLTMRVGRLGWPAYLVSDYRYVGFANPWVRAPLEVYNLAPLDNYEGADLVWSHAAGAGFLSVQVLGGHASSPMPYTSAETARLKVNQLAGAYVTYEIGDLRLRGGASTGKVSYRADNIAELTGALQMLGFGHIAGGVMADEARTTFSSLGGNYDNGKWLVTAEYAHLHSASEAIGNKSGWYATVGYHFGKWTPYATWAGYGKRDDRSGYALPPFPPLLPLASAVDGLTAGDSQHTTSVGLRWDVHDGIAIKGQVDHMQPSPVGGTFKSVVPGYDGHAVNGFSAAVDFTF